MRFAAPEISWASTADNRPSRTARSVAGNDSSRVAVPIAPRTSLRLTPSVRATEATASSADALVSETRFATLASIPSTTRRIAPSSSTTRNAASGDRVAASSSSAAEFNVARDVSSG
jgi:hypothetical protein